MTTPVGLFEGGTVVKTGGIQITAIVADTLGGYIINPQLADDQGLEDVEVLYVNAVGPAALAQRGATVALQPGQRWDIPAFTTVISVNAVSSGHRFTCVAEQSPTQYPPTSTAGAFPPLGPTVLTQATLSYPFQEYQDDANIWAFFDAYNEYAQDYVDTFTGLSLPVYTNDNIAGSLLDWVAEGLYGVLRPALSSGQITTIGPLNTWTPNTITLSTIEKISDGDVVATSDDTFKRILTWQFYKGDGKQFNIRWLKRHVWRFLFGVNGTAPNVTDTYQISVQFGTGNNVTIKFIDEITSVTGGAILNTFACNTMTCNALHTVTEQLTPLPYRQIFADAVAGGALELPFQYAWSVVI